MDDIYNLLVFLCEESETSDIFFSNLCYKLKETRLVVMDIFLLLF